MKILNEYAGGQRHLITLGRILADGLAEVNEERVSDQDCGKVFMEEVTDADKTDTDDKDAIRKAGDYSPAFSILRTGLTKLAEKNKI